MDNIQNCDSYIKISWSQIYRFHPIGYLEKEGKSEINAQVIGIKFGKEINVDCK
jgi:hypothetical protein